MSGKAVMVTPKPPKQATYAYGRAVRQRVDAYWRPELQAKAGTAKPGTPQAQAQARARAKVKPRPAVLILHGGYWLTGNKDGWKYFARRLTSQGFAVFAANYRLAPQAAWPAQRDDAEAVLDFIAAHAAKWNVDPTNIVVLGSSAGGHLATQLGTYGDGGKRVRGVVALSPVNNPYLAYQDGVKTAAGDRERKLRRAVTSLIRCMPAPDPAGPAAAPTDPAAGGGVLAPACWQRVDDANSSSHVTASDAPMLLMHSTGDFVPVTQSTGLAAALRAAGVPATVRTVQGKKHASGLLDDETVYPEILSWIKARTK